MYPAFNCIIFLFRRPSLLVEDRKHVLGAAPPGLFSKVLLSKMGDFILYLFVRRIIALKCNGAIMSHSSKCYKIILFSVYYG
jgi:hypothetical protein